VFKNFIILVSSIFIILFFALYLSQYTGYYDYSSSRRNILTDSAIERFEEDLRLGKTIDSSNYLVKEKNYNNRLSRLGMKTSYVIERIFEKGIRVVFSELNDLVSS